MQITRIAVVELIVGTIRISEVDDGDAVIERLDYVLSILVEMATSKTKTHILAVSMIFNGTVFAEMAAAQNVVNVLWPVE